MITLDHAPETPFMSPRTVGPPGLSPMDMAEWIVVQGDFGPQLAYRERLLVDEREAVLACLPEGVVATVELHDEIVAHLSTRADYGCEGEAIRRPDGMVVGPGDDPLNRIGRLVAEDFCLLLPDATSGEYRLVAAVLCFPSRWRLSEKLGRPLTPIHRPVPEYDATLSRRVNRMFDTLRPDRALVRANWMVHNNPELFMPLGEREKEHNPRAGQGPLYLRTERQSLVRLPRSGAVAFGIKTTVTPLTALTGPVLAGLCDAYRSRLSQDHADASTEIDRKDVLDRMEALLP